MVALFEGFTNYCTTVFYPKFVEILHSPVSNPSMLWMLIPLIILFISVEIYVARKKGEWLTWNLVLVNIVAIVFVILDLLRIIFARANNLVIGPVGDLILVPAILFLLVLILIYFTIVIPRWSHPVSNIWYMLARPSYLNIAAILSVILVYDPTFEVDFAINFATPFVFIAVFLLLSLISLLIYFLIPNNKPILSNVLTVEDVENFGRELHTQDKKKKSSKHKK